MDRLTGKIGSTRPSLDDCMKALDRWVLVITGPRTAAFWRATDKNNADNKIAAHHQSVLCVGCTPFCLHGACQHGYAAMLHLKMIESTLPWAEKEDTKTKARRRRRPNIVLSPGALTSLPSVAEPAGKAEASAHRPEEAVWQETQKLLRRLQLENLYGRLYDEGMHVDALRECGLPMDQLKNSLGIPLWSVVRLMKALQGECEQEHLSTAC